MDSQYELSEEECVVNKLESGVQHWAEQQELEFTAHSGAGGGPVMMGAGYVKEVLDKKQMGELEANKEKKKNANLVPLGNESPSVDPCKVELGK